MSAETIIGVVGALIIGATFAFLLYRKAPKRLNRSKYTKKWRDIQQLCVNDTNWQQAILLADQLLDTVLRRKNKVGKTMGERMVSAQDDFSNNDAVWQAHKFANHIRHTRDEIEQLQESDVKAALIAFRQALRDLGAL